MQPVKECQRTKTGCSQAPAGSLPAKEALEWEMALQMYPYIPVCRKPIQQSGSLTLRPPAGTSVDSAGGYGGFHSVHVGHKSVPQEGSRGSVGMGGMMGQHYPCRHVAQGQTCANEALVVVASGERQARARGRSSDALDEEAGPWAAHCEMLCCTPGGCTFCREDWSSGRQTELRCD